MISIDRTKRFNARHCSTVISDRSDIACCAAALFYYYIMNYDTLQRSLAVHRNAAREGAKVSAPVKR